MSISSYADFIQTAMQQSEPHRLLFVFAEAELPPNHTAGQKQGFQQGRGGVLTPVMCVDKLPEEMGSFAELVEESQAIGQGWDLVFAAALAGTGGKSPDSGAAERPLKNMINAIQQGSVNGFLAFDRDGELVQLR